MYRRAFAASAALALATAALASGPAHADWDDTGTFDFEVLADGTASIISCAVFCDEDVVVPATLSQGGEVYPVSTIGDGAFEDEFLSSVSLPEGLIHIGAEAFAGNELTQIDLPSTLESVGSDAFTWNSLGAVTVPAALTAMDDNAFRFSGVTDVTWLGSPTTIPAGAFADNEITSLVLPSSVTSIEYAAFSNNNSLASVTLPPGLEAIGGAAFAGAWFLETVTYPGAPSSTDVGIPPGVTSIGDYAFEYATELSGHLELPEGLDHLGMGAFSSNALTSVTLPQSLTTLSNGSLSGNRLTHVTIPATVTDIEEFALQGNPLETLTFLGDQPTIGMQALSTYAPDSQGPAPATVIYNMANDGFGHPTWAPYTTGFPEIDSVEHPTAPVVTVEFDAGGHAAAPAAQTVPLGSGLVEPAPLTAPGLTFEGWSNEPGGALWTFATDTVQAPTTLYAEWEVATYPVTFELGHGHDAVVVEVEHGSVPTAPEPPFVPGHRFAGWLVEGASTDLTTPITGPVTFTASYEESVYVVEAPSTATAGDTITVSGSGFDPSEQVTLELHSTPVALGTTTADATGAFTTEVTLPAEAAAGEHSIVATGAAGQASTPITIAVAPVVDPEPADPAVPAEPVDNPGESTVDDELATTGAPSLTAPLTAASALVLAGAALLATRRRVR